MGSLRTRTVRLAYTRPDLRKFLLPVLRHASLEDEMESTFGLTLFDEPRQKEVLEFAESGATSNVRQIAVNSVKENNTDRTVHQEKADVEESPYTPDEVMKKWPGTEEFSTLSRYVIDTKQPTERSMDDRPDRTTRTPDESQNSTRSLL